MKKFLTLLLVGIMSVGICASVTACDMGDYRWDGEWTTITALDKNCEEKEFEVPYNPTRIACLDFGVLDILDLLGLGDRVVAAPHNTISYLQSYVTDMNDSSKDIADVGSLRTINTEDLQQTHPDIIFISERHTKDWAIYDKICPDAVVLLSTTEVSVVEDTRENAKTIASIFGIAESKIDELFAEYDIDNRVEAINAKANEDPENPTSFLLVLYSGESAISLYGDYTSCCSIIGHEFGLKNAYDGNVTYEHGDTINWETFLKYTYDYVIVLNRGYVLTPDDDHSNEIVVDVMINKVTNGNLNTDNLFVLSSPSVWYQAKWGILALDDMCKDFETLLGINAEKAD